MRLFCAFWAICLLSFRTVFAAPNFVIFAADDLGFDDLSVHGNLDVETPYLDNLYSDSVRFENFYVDPVCAPTRASLLTGRHFLKTGVWGVHGNRDYLNLNEQTFADALRTVGYSTGIFGKWHNGVTDGYFPWDRGFDEACMVNLYQYLNNAARCNGRARPTTGWATERIADWAIDFIGRRATESFALMVPFMAPHLGYTSSGQGEFWHAPSEYVEKYLSKGLSEPLARLYAMIDFMDSQIGRILESLEAEGIRENTVVIFLSDNGPIGNHLMSTEDWERRNVHHLRGNKGDVYENGIKVPLFISWPGTYTPNTVESALVTVEDLFPTMMQLAGVSAVRNSIDGMSLVPILSNPSMDDEVWTARTLFHTKAAPDWTRVDGVYYVLPDEGSDKSELEFGREGAWAVRRQQYKYISSFGSVQLFDLEQDPQERVNLPDALRREALDNILRLWWQEILAEPGSFSRPTFYIGRTDFSELFMMGTVDTSPNIQVLSHSIMGDISPGTYLKYRAIIARAGKYDVQLNQWTEWIGEVTIDVFCGENHAAANGFLNGDLTMMIEIPFEGEDCLIQFKIRNGSGFFQAASFSFVPAIN